MAQVSVRVNGFAHVIGCRDGEEAHVARLVAQIEEKVKIIRGMGGQFSEARMLLHVALLLADELSDAGARQLPDAALLAPRLDAVAARIEAIAHTLESGEAARAG